MRRNQVFVSYSHIDSEYLARLKVHLRPFEREGLVEVWSDTKIKTGQLWKKEISEAIDGAAVAILLVSVDFLASEFIAEDELPPLLKNAEGEGVKILPVVLKPCAFLDINEISQFQSINDPHNPIVALVEADRERIWYQLARTVRDELRTFKNQQDSAMENAGNPVFEQTLVDSIDGHYYGLFSEELNDPSVIDEFSVYSYQHLDELSYMPRAEEMLSKLEGFQRAFDRIKARFRSQGWEGDGVIRLMWLPPFIGSGIEDTWGTGVWHVKQSNNGTSWLASPVPLPFSRLLEQNT